ncbi:MAG: hypothetical protein E6J90_42595 [Deltaproteobacteria bacterium]|nr:MAG: hypothetical protein E6J90_42595 [Deltaproteobacteria bacterium]
MSDTSVDPAEVAVEPPRPGVLLRIWTHKLVFWIGLAVIAGTAAHYRFIEGATTEDVLHVALLAAVLFVEFFMLGRMSRERLEREAESQLRSRVMIDLDNFRIALSRAYYLQELERGIRDARSEILFTTATMATSGDPHQRRIVEAVREKEAAIERSGGTLIHQGIVAKLPSCLPGAVELACKTRTEVRFRAYFGYTRLRFQVTDHSFSVIGVVEGEPAFDQVKSTHRSFSVESMLLAEALRDRFNGSTWMNISGTCGALVRRRTARSRRSTCSGCSRPTRPGSRARRSRPGPRSSGGCPPKPRSGPAARGTARSKAESVGHSARENARTRDSPWAAARMGVGAAPAEEPPVRARTPRGMCGARPGQS